MHVFCDLIVVLVLGVAKPEHSESALAEVDFHVAGSFEMLYELQGVVGRIALAGVRQKDDTYGFSLSRLNLTLKCFYSAFLRSMTSGTKPCSVASCAKFSAILAAVPVCEPNRT